MVSSQGDQYKSCESRDFVTSSCDGPVAAAKLLSGLVTKAKNIILLGFWSSAFGVQISGSNYVVGQYVRCL